MSPHSPSLADIQAEMRATSAHVFHASLPLYVLLERRPRPDCPQWVELACWRQNHAEGMLAFLSPLDAMIDCRERNRLGGHYQVMPFEAIDPRPFIQEHEGWLTVYLVYGFAAHGRALIQGNHGEPLALSHGTHFQITPEMEDHFHLQFPERTVAWLERLHGAADILDYGRVAQDLSEASRTELDAQAREALERVTSSDAGRDCITHCALYDPIEQQWRFAPFEALRA